MINEISKWKLELDRVGHSEGLYQIIRKPIGTDLMSWSLAENPEVVFNFLNTEVSTWKGMWWLIDSMVHLFASITENLNEAGLK